MKGIYTKQTSKQETTLKTFDFRIANAICGRRFNFYKIYRKDLIDMIKIAENNPENLIGLLNQLLTRIPPKE